jgi:hypothetical protein
MATQTVNFWTTGENLTNLYRDFILEGNYNIVFQEFVNQNIPVEEVKKFILQETKFEGDTRKDGLFIVEDTPLTKEKLAERFITGIRTLCVYEDSFEKVSDVFDRDFINLCDRKDVQKNLRALFKIFTRDELKKLLNWELCKADLGYYVVNEIKDEYFNGIILQDGSIIEVGVQEHRFAYDTLMEYGYSNDNNSWGNDCTMTLKITEGQLVGAGSHAFLKYELFKDNCDITIEQAKVVMKHIDKLKSWDRYGDNLRVDILEFIEFYHDKGGKYGKLKFLETMYPQFNLPQFDLEPIEGIKNCIRTSPKYSISGLLNSKFDISETSISEIEVDFEKYKDVVKDNELNYFYQEYLEGINGVCNYRSIGFDYACSETRGDIVQGKAGSVTLTYDQEQELETIAKILFDDLEKEVQLEFVISGDKIYIVQLKVLSDAKRESYRGNTMIDKDDIIVTGKSFYPTEKYGIKKENALIIDSDCDSSEVIGKEAVIVREDVSFSHALALSNTLKIPSIYAVGDVEIPDEFSIDTYYAEGYILRNVERKKYS